MVRWTVDLRAARSILLCLRYGIGDVVMELPALEWLRRRAPGARITALGAPPAIDLLDGDPRVDEVVSAARWGLTHRWDEGTPASRAELDRWLAARGFDLFVDVHHAAPAVGAVVRARGIRSLEADEDAEAAAVAAGRDAIAAIRAAVRAGWGLDVPEHLAPRIHLRAEERDAAAALLAAAGVDAPPIGLSPVASLPMKRWPPDRFAAVADRLTAETGRSLLLLAGPHAPDGDAVLAAMRNRDRAVRLGPLHLRTVAALLARCAVFIGNDTGLLHIAAALGTPVVGVFGPSVPEIYLPRTPHAYGAVGRGIECRYRNTKSLHPPGCWSSPHCLVAERSCVWDVPVDEVVAAALRAPGMEAGPVRLRRPGRSPAREPGAA